MCIVYDICVVWYVFVCICCMCSVVCVCAERGGGVEGRERVGTNKSKVYRVEQQAGEKS
jgi:hypothetical protein